MQCCTEMKLKFAFEIFGCNPLYAELVRGLVNFATGVARLFCPDLLG